MSRRSVRHGRIRRPRKAFQQIVLLALILTMLILFWEQLSEGAASCALNMGRSGR
ncbi:MAG: hypothetical protein ABIK09_15000 [Pseudomonadota bacterium]